MGPVDAVMDRFEAATSLTVVCHDDPDPDCLSAAIALELLAREAGVGDVDIVYGGSISHRQNRAFVNLFDLELSRISTDRLDGTDVLAFVDHSIPGRHNGVPAGTSLDIVIDHHPVDEPVPAEVVDVRPEYGATASILTEYFRDVDVQLTTRVASGLLFGVHRERLDFIRRPTVHEYDAAGFLDPRADMDTLRELYGASFTAEAVDAVGEAIRNRVTRDSCLFSCVGRVGNHDALTQAADYLLNIEGVNTVLVCGIVGDEVQLSARTIRGDIDLGYRVGAAFGDVGTAGGHRDMAGGQLPLGLFADPGEDDPGLVEMVGRRVRRRFFDVMGVGG